MIYLDSASTTKIDDSVLDEMMPYLTDNYGNPGSTHSFGTRVSRAIELARERVANFIGASPNQIIFTSGGSEANNLAIRGTREYCSGIGRDAIIIGATEHESIIRSSEKYVVWRVGVDKKGRLDLKTLEKYLVMNDKPGVGLASIMYVNNEIGAINRVSDISDICKTHGVLFHTDCVQAAGCHEIDVEKMGCDMASISSHKIHGPKGVGALYVRNKDIISPIIAGGSAQEFGIRGGTENVPGIVGFGKACEMAKASADRNLRITTRLKHIFFEALIDSMGCSDARISVNGGSLDTPGKTLNIAIADIDSETLVLMLSAHGLCVSSGAACSSHESNPSHVLTAIGLSAEEARSSIRISFSKDNTESDAVNGAKIMAECIKAIRSFGDDVQI